MRLAMVIALVVATFLSGAPPAGAGGNPGVELALVCQPHEARGCEVYTSCGQMQYIYGGEGSYDLIVVAYNYSGLTALGYALDYSDVVGAEFGAFVHCATIGSVTAQHAGYIAVADAWGGCQAPPDPGAGITVGWLELWGGEGRIDFAPEAMDGGLVAVDCSYQRDVIQVTHSGFVGGELPRAGDTSPCDEPLAAETSSWGGVKSLYR